ncbi:MAG: hypothetical protein EOP59_01965, partial [Sphingomonadales bacterium]
LKKVGERFEVGDPLYECETEKAVTEVEATRAGIRAVIRLRRRGRSPCRPARHRPRRSGFRAGSRRGSPRLR